MTPAASWSLLLLAAGLVIFIVWCCLRASALSEPSERFRGEMDALKKVTKR